ncbi:hypothetical protein DAERI_140111 [Deinococcus aerius]|uniref:S23 ribosomal protein n=1 Tax=Deinococcus aerius TaxID=200253 RepID=A0A2I9DA12_9DEIO|nr:four helix bundle protein [Deinococcus aerius]GBF07450.1 hypothetical protein DAERI_140111 [Deinococcus aerius]
MRDFRNFSVWRKAHALTLRVYAVSGGFPLDERYGLTSQIRRAVASVPTNIAEGCGRGSWSDMRRFLLIAFGSASETEYLILLTRDLGYLGQEQSGELLQAVQEVKRMLGGLVAKIDLKLSVGSAGSAALSDR